MDLDKKPVVVPALTIEVGEKKPEVVVTSITTKLPDLDLNSPKQTVMIIGGKQPESKLSETIDESRRPF